MLLTGCDDITCLAQECVREGAGRTEDWSLPVRPAEKAEAGSGESQCQPLVRTVSSCPLSPTTGPLLLSASLPDTEAGVVDTQHTPSPWVYSVFQMGGWRNRDVLLD